MNIDTFAVIGGDLRCAYLAGLLAADGYKVITSGFDSTDLPPCVTGCTNPAQAVSLADFIILPVPVSTDGTTINAPFSRVRISLDQVLNAVKPEQQLVGGAITKEVHEEAKKRGISITDYLHREELAVYNAVPTAEGAIQLAMEELPITLGGSHCLITGYGRVGRTLSRLLVALGAQVSVTARNFSDLAWADSEGCKSFELMHLSDAGDFDVIFNTIPFPVFDRDILSKLDKNTLLIDLASRPGGIDFIAAAELQLKTIWALSLPGRVAPKTAGQIIKNTILNMLKEGV
ncbi:MAG: dipicolinate synthase subunit DpsA [Oscillospiraceae bacterium]|nr:dipicolinate synthase subunit DpsA [Oscillospiraceae bacterium]MDD3833427.1 dipicolinate synthase subunit DpsA [Oscillospiraceae bacterium]MDD4546951.1 dipicolinate synthase subunit DpsA [Oscillospiraceae bacterium]